MLSTTVQLLVLRRLRRSRQTITGNNMSAAGIQNKISGKLLLVAGEPRMRQHQQNLRVSTFLNHKFTVQRTAPDEFRTVTSYASVRKNKRCNICLCDCVRAALTFQNNKILCGVVEHAYAVCATDE